jgi:RES domain-containing protein
MAVTILDERPEAKELSDTGREKKAMLLEVMDSVIDSWCSSSIACCDGCYEDFADKWPLAYTRIDGIHANRIDVDTFYTNQWKLRGLFSRSDFLSLLPYVACPRCGESIGHHLYPFEFPFDPQDFEKALARLGRLANTAPFLLLTDPLASKVKDSISHLCNVSNVGRDIPHPMYRGRRLDRKPVPEDFLAPPAEITREGRYNHAGRPVLYLANDRKTCWEECRRPDQNFHVAEIRITTPIRILDLASAEELGDDLAALLYSNLMTAPSSGQGWAKPEYVLTRFVGDCARKEDIDAIKYPSTRSGKGENIVLLNPRQLTASIHTSQIAIYG